jgi:hypothetical protein
VQEGNPDGHAFDKKQDLFLLIALSAVAASTMFVEVVIIKFIAFKVFHHFVNIIVSTVVLSFGAAGTFLFMRTSAGKPVQSDWQGAARDAAIYSVSLLLVVLLFCWLPIDPYNRELADFWRLASLPVYFALFVCPFFFGGLCISKVLADSRLRPSRVLLWDLTAAALAAATAPSLLEALGGYGAIGAAAAFGMVAFFAFQKASAKLHPPSCIAWSAAFLTSLALLLAYPGWAIKKYGIDIRSHKGENLQNLFATDFNGLGQTYWNALARIDVSNVGWSNDAATYFYDFVDRKEKLEGRLITVDKGANTRQFVNKGKLRDQKFIGDSIVAIPYVARPGAQDTLIIGGGGGIDITVAKYFQTPHVSVLELNPMTYKHVLLGEGDPQRALFQPWIESDDKTKVSIFNKEARHFCSASPPHAYDVIQATGVDTFTAVASGALAYSDNYLYTQDAIDSYTRLLRPGGVLSLAYCRHPESLPLRLFTTYISALEKQGNKEPWRNLIVVGATMDADVMVKTTPFTEAELEGIRDWCKRTGYCLIFDPDRKTGLAAGMVPVEELYQKLAFSSAGERKKIIDTFISNIEPASDDKPYFYQIDRSESWFFSNNYAYTPMVAVILVFLFSLFLIFVPMTRISREKLSLSILGYALFFATCGFAFLFFEVAIVQLFTVFVGGPAYALAVVLVSVLIGYSIGCYIVSRLQPRPSTFYAIGAMLFAINMGAFLFLPQTITALLFLDFPARLASCAAITLFLACIAGLPVPLAMESAKTAYNREIAWFWGVNCAFNALGAACFPLISYQIGIKASLVIVAVLYLLANLAFGFLCVKDKKLSSVV